MVSSSMRLLRTILLALGVAGPLLLRAQTPAATQPLPAQTFGYADPAVTLDLRNHFALPGVTGQVVQFDTVLGRFNVEMLSDAAPLHVANFLNYVDNGRYAGTFFHRSASLDGTAPVSIIQGGGYRIAGNSLSDVIKFPAVPLEYKLPNSRGTLAAARTSDVNSATSEWYFNVRDNSTILGQANGGGYTVFARVIGTGMAVVDAIAALPRFPFQSPFNELPLRNYTSGDPSIASFILVNSVSTATLFPTGNGPSVVSFLATSASTDVAEVAVSGSTLTLTPRGGGTTVITVRAFDTNANFVEATCTVTVRALAPSFVSEPLSATVAAGGTAVLSSGAPGASSYRWFRNGIAVAGATSGLLVLPNVQPAQEGTYTVTAANGAGLTISRPATLTVATVPAADQGRLVNLSVLTPVNNGSNLTVGAVIGPGTAGSLPLVVRAVGPTLASAFSLATAMADPRLNLYAAGADTPLATNDNWGGGDVLTAAFASVGAFPLPAGSRDAAIARPAPGVAAGGYSAVVAAPPGGTGGDVLTEVYDASPGDRVANAPRLINLSVLKQIDANGLLTAGFVVRGQSARTVLIRAVGPTLRETFLIGDAMADPVLALFDGAAVKIGENDNWGGDRQLGQVTEDVGAFSLASGSSRDAVLLLTLPPGNYSAQVRGQGGAGSVLVEVYEVP